jgi:hypothetical protein
MSDQLARTVARIMATGDALPEWQRRAIGGLAVRVHVPLRDVIDLRRCMGLGIIAMRSVQTLAHHSKLEDWRILSQACTDLRMAGAAMKDGTTEEEFQRMLAGSR